MHPLENILLRFQKLFQENGPNFGNSPGFLENRRVRIRDLLDRKPGENCIEGIFFKRQRKHVSPYKFYIPSRNSLSNNLPVEPAHKTQCFNRGVRKIMRRGFNATFSQIYPAENFYLRMHNRHRKADEAISAP